MVSGGFQTRFIGVIEFQVVSWGVRESFSDISAGPRRSVGDSSTNPERYKVCDMVRLMA